MKWLGDNWKILAAGIYLLICILDFIIMPSFIAYAEFKFELTFDQILELIDKPEVLALVVERNDASNWIPYSLRGGGMFHISFGAILTGTILRKKEDETN